MGEFFRDSNHDRLVRRISALTSGDLNHEQIGRLVDGDADLIKDIAPAARPKIVALATSEGRGALEKRVGPTIDYVPVAFLEAAQRAAATVARIIDGKRGGLGTGAMVTPRLMLTNNHVLPNEAAAAECSAQFDYELGIDGRPKEVTEFRFDPATFFWTSPEEELDCTLVAVAPDRFAGPRSLDSFGWTALSSAGDKHATGDHVTVIQHPDSDFKQIALRDNRVLGRGLGKVTLYYEADTLGGASGSPVFNDDFDLVALHHAGGRVNDDTFENGDPVPDDVNEGIRISAIVNKLRELHDTLPPAPRALVSEALNPPTPPIASASLEARSGAAAPLDAAGLGSVGALVAGDLHLPHLRISTGAAPLQALKFTADSPAGTPTTGISTGAVLERNDAPQPEYDKRPGYDPGFLQIEVPAPTIPKAVLKVCAAPTGVRRSAASVLLPYHHFSVVVRGDRRLPLFTLVNIDGRKLRGINRKTGVVEAAETWFTDPRIGEDEQLNQTIFDGQRPRIFDRGHMVRRLDPAWGSPSMAKVAADDTFHFTNCSPQLLRFNQQLWQGIENFALNNARDEKKQITVMTGPVFEDTDPAFRGIQVPREFWKVVVRRHEGTLRATGFLADQGVALEDALASHAAALETFVDLGKVAVFNKPISEIEAKTGLNFGNLQAHDSHTGGLEAADRPLDDLSDAAW